jgi:NADH-ubiquinone oxidoreductase chain 5
LPAAIAAPTPVSALVHSSTLVTAGVFLLIRFNFLLVNRYFSYILIIIGIFTIILAGAAAINEIDIKKIIALSTLSQLGVIIITLGFQEPVLSFFHLLSHAYFKAILFICAGIIIHNIRDYQDIRKIRSISKNIPLTFRVLRVANLRLCGLPFLRGFYSKDLILECIIISDINLFNYILIMLGTILTVLYSLRISILLRISSRTKDTLIISSDTDKFIHLGI